MQQTHIIRDGILVVRTPVCGTHPIDTKPAIFIHGKPDGIDIPTLDGLHGSRIHRTMKDSPTLHTCIFRARTIHTQQTYGLSAAVDQLIANHPDRQSRSRRRIGWWWSGWWRGLWSRRWRGLWSNRWCRRQRECQSNRAFRTHLDDDRPGHSPRGDLNVYRGTSGCHYLSRDGCRIWSGKGYYVLCSTRTEAVPPNYDNGEGLAAGRLQA